jgi:predicted regulator of Ras-like GTPase activity (Roadblock/LC7/MglB family)
MAVLVVDGTGGILAQKMGEGWKETRLDGLAALAAGSFAASNEMARMLGETGRFKMLLHEGQQRNLFVCSITPSHFLVVAFESGVALGMIRIFTKRTVEQLAPVLSEAGQPGGDLGKLFDGNFQSMLDEELDRSFVEKR